MARTDDPLPKGGVLPTTCTGAIGKAPPEKEVRMVLTGCPCGRRAAPGARARSPQRGDRMFCRDVQADDGLHRGARARSPQQVIAWFLRDVRADNVLRLQTERINRRMNALLPDDLRRNTGKKEALPTVYSHTSRGRDRPKAWLQPA